MKLQALFDTDPLALGALAGLAATILITAMLFAFLLSRRGAPKS